MKNQTMKTSPQSKAEKVIHEIASTVTFERPIRWFGLWLDRKIKRDVYVLQEGEIISSGFAFHQQRIAVQDIRTWQEIYIGGGVPFVCIRLANGKALDWTDRYEHLFRILREIAPEEELPYENI
jgi:hypothetical protein